MRPTSIQINYNFCGAVHVDGNNLGPSNIVAVGCCQGGSLLVECKRGGVQHELVTESGGRGTSITFRTPGIGCRELSSGSVAGAGLVPNAELQIVILPDKMEGQYHFAQ